VNGVTDPQEPDTLDRIANALPPEVRADYYREMRHLRSLPENDEMLRILRAMQFLGVLIFDAPLRTAAENDKLKEMFADAFGTLHEVLLSIKTQQTQIDQRLAQLPQYVAVGIKPAAIAAAVNESLRQLFLQSTIPETASALAVTSAQMKKGNVELMQTSSELSDIHRGIVGETRRAIAGLKSESSELKKEAANSKHVFDRGKRVSFSAILIFGLSTGLALEYWFQRSFFPPTAQIVCSPALPAPPVKLSTGKMPQTKLRAKH
jgi:hypothetical protein